MPFYASDCREIFFVPKRISSCGMKAASPYAGLKVPHDDSDERQEMDL
jgi:hypothetical protein